jgi:putative membrane protein
LAGALRARRVVVAEQWTPGRTPSWEQGVRTTLVLAVCGLGLLAEVLDARSNRAQVAQAPPWLATLLIAFLASPLLPVALTLWGVRSRWDAVRRRRYQTAATWGMYVLTLVVNGVIVAYHHLNPHLALTPQMEGGHLASTAYLAGLVGMLCICLPLPRAYWTFAPLTTLMLLVRWYAGGEPLRVVVLDTTFGTLLCLVYFPFLSRFLEQGERLDAAVRATQATLEAGAASASRVRAGRVVASMVHDRVIAALVTASRVRGASDEEVRHQARQALEVMLPTAQDAADPGRHDLADLEAALRQVVQDQVGGRCRTVVRAELLDPRMALPAPAWEALLLAAQEAVRNVRRHAVPAAGPGVPGGGMEAGVPGGGSPGGGVTRGRGSSEVTEVGGLPPAPRAGPAPGPEVTEVGGTPSEGVTLSVTLRGRVAGVVIEVIDDGPGFSLSRLSPERMGLRGSVLARMESLQGGGARVESEPGRGTRVTLTWEPSGGGATPPPRPGLLTQAHRYLHSPRGRGVGLLLVATMWLHGLMQPSTHAVGLVLVALVVQSAAVVLLIRGPAGPWGGWVHVLAPCAAALAAVIVGSGLPPGALAISSAGWAVPFTALACVAPLMHRRDVLAFLTLAASGAGLWVGAHAVGVDHLVVLRFLPYPLVQALNVWLAGVALRWMRRRLSREQARAQAACVRQAAQEEAVRVQEDFLREVRGRSLKVIGQLALRGAIPELVEQAGWVEADLRDLIRAPRLAADAELTTLVRQARRAGVVVVQLDDSGVPVAPVAPADGGCRGGEGTLTAATGHLDTAPSGARGEGTHLAGRKDAALGSVPRGGEGPERPPDLRNALGSVPRGGEGPAPVTNGDLPGRPVPRGVGPGPGAGSEAGPGAQEPAGTAGSGRATASGLPLGLVDAVRAVLREADGGDQLVVRLTPPHAPSQATIQLRRAGRVLRLEEI